MMNEVDKGCNGPVVILSECQHDGFGSSPMWTLPNIPASPQNDKPNG